LDSPATVEPVQIIQESLILLLIASKQWYSSDVLDEKTSLLETLLLHIAETAHKEHKPYYFGGGIAVDLSLGGLSRPHGDLERVL
jgi:hypothetical protein